jgi:hypothetical protein
MLAPPHTLHFAFVRSFRPMQWNENTGISLPVLESNGGALELPVGNRPRCVAEWTL